MVHGLVLGNMSEKQLEVETERLIHLLKDAVHYSRFSNREVERRMGYSSNSGYLSRLFAGTRELKIRQLLQILQTIGMSPSSFFHAAYLATFLGRKLDEHSWHPLGHQRW